MDIAPLVAGLLIGAGVGAQAGHWLGKRRSAVDRAVVDAAARLRDASANLEVTLEDRADSGLLEEVAGRWNALEGALDKLEPPSGPPNSDFT